MAQISQFSKWSKPKSTSLYRKGEQIRHSLFLQGQICHFDSTYKYPTVRFPQYSHHCKPLSLSLSLKTFLFQLRFSTVSKREEFYKRTFTGRRRLQNHDGFSFIHCETDASSFSCFRREFSENSDYRDAILPRSVVGRPFPFVSREMVD